MKPVRGPRKNYQPSKRAKRIVRILEPLPYADEIVVERGRRVLVPVPLFDHRRICWHVDAILGRDRRFAELIERFEEHVEYVDSLRRTIASSLALTSDRQRGAQLRSLAKNVPKARSPLQQWSAEVEALALYDQFHRQLQNIGPSLLGMSTQGALRKIARKYRVLAIRLRAPDTSPKTVALLTSPQTGHTHKHGRYQKIAADLASTDVVSARKILRLADSRPT